MYLDDLAAEIRSHIPADRMPGGNPEDLLRIYAVLLRAKGVNVTEEDVHDAWSAWMAGSGRAHDSLIPFEELPPAVQLEDFVFAEAIRRAAEASGHVTGADGRFTEVLFPTGPPRSETERREAFDLYKIMVESSEALVSRRQAVNTFFLTMNGALLTALVFVVQSANGNRLAGLGVALLSITGAILCATWRSLITSFGQLNGGKFKVINTIERYFKASIYAAEWEALDRGENPKVYRSFTSREIWVPTVLGIVYATTVVVAILVASGLIVFGGVVEDSL